MTTTYDTIVVGARCAGAPLAMLLANAGHQVLLVDRATFPSDTMSTHFIQAPGMARLAKWGMVDELFATNCPPVQRARFDVNGEAMDLELPAHAGFPGLAAPRRYVLDKMLVDAAVAAGVELAQGTIVEGLVREADRVIGVSGRTPQGPFEAHGRLVVGADGRHSLVARETQAAFDRYEPPLTSGYYSYFRDAGLEGTTIYFHDGVMSVMFPTNDGLATIGVIWPRARFDEVKRDIDAHFRGALRSLGDHGAHISRCDRAERYVGAADLATYTRTAFGPGWALVGDACYHKDPIPADGISDAFRGAEFLAEAVDAVLVGAEREPDALGRYRERHDASISAHFDAAVRSADFARPARERCDAFLESRLHDEAEVEALEAAHTHT